MIRVLYDNNKKTLCTMCKDCGRIVEIPCTPTQLKKYNNGALIQQVFPNLSADDREIFQSGICNDCFEKIFEGMEE